MTFSNFLKLKLIISQIKISQKGYFTMAILKNISEIEPNIDHLLKGRVTGLQINGYGSLERAKYEPPKIDFEKIKISSTVGVKFILK